MEPDQYYYYLRESSESPFFVVNPARIPKITNWTGLYTIQQSSFTIAPYLRYELIEMGDLAFFMELNAYYTRTFEGKRHALKGSGTGGHPFHDATLVAAVADHAGDGGCHVVQHILHSLQISALEPADGYCHAGAGSMSFLIS